MKRRSVAFWTLSPSDDPCTAGDAGGGGCLSGDGSEIDRTARDVASGRTQAR